MSVACNKGKNPNKIFETGLLLSSKAKYERLVVLATSVIDSYGLTEVSVIM